MLDQRLKPMMKTARIQQKLQIQHPIFPPLIVSLRSAAKHMLMARASGEPIKVAASLFIRASTRLL